MKIKPKSSIAEHFEGVTDPRIERSKEHCLSDILTIAILAVICGADGWVGIASYGEAKKVWLKTFLALPNGIPSHDTFSRVFARLNPEELQNAFLSWVRSVSQLTTGEVIAIDGKTVRRSYDKGDGKGAIHMVSAWASQNRLVLGQRKVDEKSNEITAIPELLKVLDLHGCIVTIDALALACRRLREPKRPLQRKLWLKVATTCSRSKAIRATCMKMCNSYLIGPALKTSRTLTTTFMKR